MSKELEGTLAEVKRRKLYTTAEISQIFGLHPSLLARKRADGSGPKYFKSGRGKTAVVRYRISELDDWIDAQMLSSTSQDFANAT